MRPSRASELDGSTTVTVLLRGAILSRTYGTDKKTTYFAIFTENIWSCLLWFPVTVYQLIVAVDYAVVVVVVVVVVGGSGGGGADVVDTMHLARRIFVTRSCFTAPWVCNTAHVVN